MGGEKLKWLQLAHHQLINQQRPHLVHTEKLKPMIKGPISYLKSVRVHFAYGRIALTLELLGRFGRFLDEDDRHSPPVLLIPFLRLLGL